MQGIPLGSKSQPGAILGSSGKEEASSSAMRSQSMAAKFSIEGTLRRRRGDCRSDLSRKTG